MRYLIVDFPARPVRRYEAPCDRCQGAGVVERFAPEQRVLDADTVLLVQVLCPWCAGCCLAGPHHRRCEGTHGAMPLDHAYGDDDPGEHELFRDLIIGAPETFRQDAYTVPRERLNGQATKMRATAYATRLKKQSCWLCAGVGWLPRPLTNRAARQDLEALVGDVLVCDEFGPRWFTLAYPCPCAMSRAREVERPTGY